MTDPDLLISGHLDNTLDEREHTELEAWLESDRANRLRFLRAVADHQALSKRTRPLSHVSRRTLRRIRRSRRPSPLRFAIPLVAALAAVLIITVMLRGGGEVPATTPDAPVVEVVEAIEVVDAAAELPMIAAATDATIVRGNTTTAAATTSTLAAGDRIRVGATGALDLRYRDGTALHLGGGSTCLVLADAAGKRVALETGTMSAEVSPQPSGKPAAFTTGNAEVTVIGTALSIATSGGESSVAVTHGRVGLRRTGDGARIELGPGETSLVAADLPLRARPTGSPVGTVHRVGPGQPYATLAAVPSLVAGDVIELHSGTYREALRFPIDGTYLRPITIRGVGAQRPLIDGTGVETIGIGAVPRGLLQIEGDHYVIEHLHLIGARNGEGSAAIRAHESDDTAIRDCVISDSDVGLDLIGDNLLIEDCDIGGCGTVSAQGPSPTVRVHGGRAVLRGNHLHDSVHGLLLKSACRDLEVSANRFIAADEGEISLASAGVDADHRIVFIGNLIAGRAVRAGNRLRCITVDVQPGTMTGTLDLVNNTFVAADPGVVFVIANDSGLAVRVDNSIFVGSGQIARPGPGGISGRANWTMPGATVPSGFSDAVPGSDPGFVDPTEGDFRLRRESPCRGRGVDSRPVQRQPAAQPAAGSVPRRDGRDLGAFAG